MIPALIQLSARRRDTASGLPRPSGCGSLVAIFVGLIALAIVGSVAGPMGQLLVLVVGGVICALPPVRALFCRRRAEAEHRRRCFHLSEVLSVVMGRPVWVGRVAQGPTGDRLFAQVSVGLSCADLERRGDAIAASLGARAVRIQRSPDNASWGEIAVVRRDPFAHDQVAGWPGLGVARTSLWDPVPVGVDEAGSVVTITLPEHNLLLGGEPGAGKSAALSLLVAAAALDPSTRLWLLDGKTVELSQWADCAAASVGPDIKEAVNVLHLVQAEMEARYRRLHDLGRRKVDASLGLPLHVVVCDELALYLAVGDRKARTDFAEVLRDLVARGRAAGVVVLAATQKPSSDVVPTSVRDLFGFRWALRCATRDASDTVLGSGWATDGYSATDIDAANRGLGYLLAEGGVPIKLRAFYLDDRSIATLATRAAGLRHHEGGVW